MSTAKRFEDLRAWKLARELTRDTYRLTADKPFSRDFGLRDQIQRAAVSIMSNIAEGFESRTQRVFIDLLGRARGSAGEVRCQLYVAHDLGYITSDQLNQNRKKAEEVSRIIHGLVRYLEKLPNDSRIREEDIPYNE